MDDRTRTRNSKFLALVLRHQPESIGLTLDKEGWADVPELLEALGRKGTRLTLEDLQELVRLDAKGRYQLEGSRIRAVQGHSTGQVDREFAEREPPELLFHGTTSAVLAPVRADGLKPMSRQYVHLSPDERTAKVVGARHVKSGDRLVVLEIDSGRMHRDGVRFFLAENGVWLVEQVLPQYLRER